MTRLLIDACARREQSRTLRLARRVTERLGGEWDCLRLYGEDAVSPLDSAALTERTALCARQSWEHPLFEPARRFREAETVVIAAPYWDLSFPAALKALFEQLCVIGLTFRYSEADEPVSLCRLKRVIYVTTAGGPILSDEPGFGYVRLVMRAFFGAEEVSQIKAEGLDLRGADAEAILARAMAEADALCPG